MVGTRSRGTDAVASVVVVSRSAAADGVVTLELAAPDGRRLPDWAPGAHVDLVLPNGVTRQYSLCGDRWDAHTPGSGCCANPTAAAAPPTCTTGSRSAT